MEFKQFIILYHFENMEGRIQDAYDIIDSEIEKDDWLGWLLGDECGLTDVSIHKIIELNDAIIHEYKNNKPKECI